MAQWLSCSLHATALQLSLDHSDLTHHHHHHHPLPHFFYHHRGRQWTRSDHNFTSPQRSISHGRDLRRRSQRRRPRVSLNAASGQRPKTKRLLRLCPRCSKHSEPAFFRGGDHVPATPAVRRLPAQPDLRRQSSRQLYQKLRRSGCKNKRLGGQSGATAACAEDENPG
jgi:hypothetical protein